MPSVGKQNGRLKLVGEPQLQVVVDPARVCSVVAEVDEPMNV